MPAIPSIAPTDFAARPFDILVVGGGTAGLAVAARLAQDPRNLSVGVLEAGPAVLNHDLVDVPGHVGRVLGTDLDWRFETVPQEGLGGRSLPWPRGKLLGGTSALNYMTWNRASRRDYDAWEELGNPGWGWDGLLPYFKKSESFHVPSQEVQRGASAHFDGDALGKNGPIDVAYCKEYSVSHGLWHQTLETLGVQTNKAHLSGSNVGAWTTVCSVDPDDCSRSYAASAYYLPNAARSNLAVLTEALVNEVVLGRDENEGEWVARGVRFTHQGEEYFVAAAREVIVSAGSVQSPQILELSGVGNPEILSRAGIEVKIDNPNVGENLQDHLMTATIFEVDPSLANPDDLKTDSAFATAAHEAYTASKTGPLTILPTSICYLPLAHLLPDPTLSSLASRAASLDDAHASPNTPRNQRPAAPSAANLGQVEYIFHLGNWSPYFRPDPEPAPGSGAAKKYGTVLQILQHPFSRGRVHVRSAAASDPPTIDPGYYAGAGGALDLDAMAGCQPFAWRLCATAPLAGVVRARAWPPPPPPSARGHDNDNDDEAEVRSWVVDNTVTDWHPVGTCAMGGARGRGAGVVDARLRVYGARRLRVVDASVMPLQVGAHLQATVYAIAEKAADLVLEDLAGLDG